MADRPAQIDVALDSVALAALEADGLAVSAMRKLATARRLQDDALMELSEVRRQVAMVDDSHRLARLHRDQAKRRPTRPKRAHPDLPVAAPGS